jgi:hypothetical protein
MKKSTFVIVIFIGLSLFLAGCPFPGPPTEEPPPVLQILTPFDAGPISGYIPGHFFETPYVMRLGTPVEDMKVRDPGYYYPRTPIAYPEKIRLSTLPSIFFDVLRAYVVLCDGEYYAVAHVINLGGFAFESAALSVHSLTLSSTSPALNTPFNKDSNDCPVGKGASKLMPGHKAFLYQPFEPDLRSPCVNFLITLCSKDNLGGYCAEGGIGVCQYAVGSSPKDTPTPTTVSCDFDCDCEPNQGETEYNCPKDCPKHCGNGICDCGENSATCKKDCGKSEGDGAKPCVCGDGICNKSSGCEEHIYCYNDCS